MITSVFKEPKGLLLEENLKVNPVKNYSFVKDAIVINLANNEIELAAMDYPIMFAKTQDGFLPVALMGLKDKNLFINANGSWVKDKYIPSFFRTYPFALVKNPTGDNHTIVYDNAYNGINKPKGLDIVSDGKFTEIGQESVDFMSAQYKSLAESKFICNIFQEYGLFQQVELKTKAEDEEYKTAGLYKINTDKVNSLDDEKLLKLVKSSGLRMIDCHLLSLHNIKKLTK